MSGDVVRRASLKLEGKALEGGLLPRHLIDHLTTTLIGRQLLEPFFFAIKHADACRTIHLMTTKGEEIAIHRLHIHLEVGRTLGTIHQDRDIVSVGHTDNLLHRINRS